MRVEVVGVGTELLLGQIVNTNARWIGERLAEIGADVAVPSRSSATTSTASCEVLALGGSAGPTWCS